MTRATVPSLFVSVSIGLVAQSATAGLYREPDRRRPHPPARLVVIATGSHVNG